MNTTAHNDKFNTPQAVKLEWVKSVTCEKRNKRIAADKASLVANRSTGEWSIYSFKAADANPHLYAMPIASMQTQADLQKRLTELGQRPWFEPEEFWAVVQRVYLNP